MSKEIISRAEFARRANVSAAAVTKACTKRLIKAVVGKRIDAAHPDAIKYLESQKPKVDIVINGETFKPAESKRGWDAKNEQKKKDDQSQPIEVPENIEEFADMSLRDIIDKFGTDVRFLDWLKATKEIEIINEKRIKNAISKNELVSRELVKFGIIDPIDSTFTKLLTDGSKTIARRATAMQDSGRSLADIEDFVKDQIASFIRPMKAKIKRSFKNVKH